MQQKSFKRFLRPLCLSLVGLTTGLGQSQSSGGSYRIAVIDGDGVLNSVASKMSREPVIQVADNNHRPVAGAYVEFDSPGNGASANFSNGSTHFATTTNSDGLAVGSSMKNNGIPGAYMVLVHVSFRGQGIGETEIHQTNIAGNVSKNMQPGTVSRGGASGAEVTGNITLSNNVVGIALGDQFLVNGASTPSNANLLKGTRIQTLEKATTLYLHERCEYLVGPRSAVTVNSKMVTLETGSVRAKRFGDCRIMYGGLWVTGDANSDGVAALTGRNLEVASVGGTVEVVNSAGDVLSKLAPGAVSSFGSSTNLPSGASISGGSASPFKTALLMGGGASVALAGLGLATDAWLQPNSSKSVVLKPSLSRFDVPALALPDTIAPASSQIPTSR